MNRFGNESDCIDIHGSVSKVGDTYVSVASNRVLILRSSWESLATLDLTYLT